MASWCGMKGGGGVGGGGDSGSDANRTHIETHKRARAPCELAQRPVRDRALLTADRMENAPTRPRFTRVADGRRFSLCSVRVFVTLADFFYCRRRTLVMCDIRVCVCLVRVCV